MTIILTGPEERGREFGLEFELDQKVCAMKENWSVQLQLDFRFFYLLQFSMAHVHEMTLTHESTHE